MKNIYRKIFALITAVCLICSLIPADRVQVRASDYYTMNGVEIGKYSDVERVKVDGIDGTVSFNPDLGMIVQVYGSDLTKINIPAEINGVKVRSIADWAIQYRENVTELTLPEGLEQIGQGAFRGLNVKKIVIPDSVTSIGNSAFSNSDNLEEVVIGSGVKEIGGSSLRYDENLKSVIFKDGTVAKTLGDWSLLDDPSLEYIYFGEGFTKLGQGTGRSCSKLETVYFPTTLKSIGNYAFRYCNKLENVTVGKTEIDYVHQFGELGISLGDYPFTNCYFIRKDFSPSYKTSKWYKALHELELTGDYPTDIVMIARSQLDYHEGNTFDEQHGNNQSGKKDFAEYNYFYGTPGTMWCGEFVDWCIMMAGVPKELYSLDSDDEAHEYTWADTTYAGGSHKLQKGDVILFLHDEGDHVILVESVEKSGDVVTVHALDGNHSQSVVTSSWEINAKTGKTLDSFTSTNGYVATIYGPDWSLADSVKYYKVSFDANGGSTSTASKKVSNGAFYGILPIPERSGYEFEGWYTAKDGGKKITSYRTVDLTGDTKLYAHWTKTGKNTGDEKDGSGKTTGTGSEEISKSSPVKITASASKLKKSALKKKTKTVTIGIKGDTANIKSVKYSDVSEKKLKGYISIMDDGKIVFSKGTPKGTYKIKVTVTYIDGSQTVKTIKIKVK